MAGYKTQSFNERKIKMKKFAMMIGFVLAASVAFAGQFGFEMGTDVNSYDVSYEQVNTNTYRFKNAPINHSAFEYYVVKSYPGYGITYIKAVSHNIRTNVYGTAVRSKFETMEDALSRKYGYGKRYDFLMPDSIWDDAKDWMMGILKDERILTTIWSDQNGSDIPEDIDTICLATDAVNRNKGYIVVEYCSKNHEAAQKASAAKQNDAF